MFIRTIVLLNILKISCLCTHAKCANTVYVHGFAIEIQKHQLQDIYVRVLNL